MAKLSVAMLTWNMFKTHRDLLFRESLASINRAGVPYEVTLVTNGSTDKTSELVQSMGGIVDDARSEMWWGMERAIVEASNKCDSPDDVILFTADDIVYDDDWGVQLLDFWAEPPEDTGIASLFLEDCREWNEVIGYGESERGVRWIERASTPGSCWSFPLRNLMHILPVGHTSPGEDLVVCERLREKGLRMFQLDLADHAGETRSAWGNKSHTHATPLDRAQYGFPERG